MRSLLARLFLGWRHRLSSLSGSWKGYVIQYVFMFITVTSVCCLLFSGVEKQTVTSVQSIATLESILSIVSQNTLVFLFILSSYYTGRIPVYSFIVANSIMLALLISSFSEPSYFLLILPHGVPEFLVFFTLAAIAEEARKKGDTERIPFFKKAVALYILLLISALVEIFITPALFSLFH